jgi:hypothetical protein
MLLLVVSNLYAYKKFCVARYNHRNPEQDHHSFEERMQQKTPITAKKAAYTFSYSNGIGRCFVQITKKERRKIQEMLTLYQTSRLIDETFIRQLATGKTKYQVMAWVLEDFKRAYNTITVGDVIGRLGTDTLK